MSPISSTTPCRRIHLAAWFLRTAVALMALAVAPLAAVEALRNFDVPAGSAEATLKLFSEQSGRGVIFATDGVKGITTNPVRGQFASRDALDRLIARTGLTIRYDEHSGSFSIVRPPPSSSSGVDDAKSTSTDKKRT